MPRIRAASIAEHKSLTRDDILDAAAALFTAHGYGDTALGEIASFAGIGRTTLYEYFTDKEDVLASLVEDRVPHAIDAIVDGLPEGATARQRLAELVIRMFEFITDDSNLGTLLMRETPRLSEPAQARIRVAHRRVEEEIAALCERGIASGEFRSFEPEEASRLVFAVTWSASQALLHDIEAKQRRHELAETVVRFVFEGLSVRA
jgi:AcrR family transcriptional regulator